MKVRVPQQYQRVAGRKHWIRLFGFDSESPLSEDEADEIMQWSMQTQCGVRMSFDMWKFNNEAELTAFVLKWC